MIALTIDNSLCRIEGLTPEEYKGLRAALSYKATANYGVPDSHPPQVRYLLGRQGDFPTGLLYLVQEYLQKHTLSHDISDLRVCPCPIRGEFNATLPYPPYPEQEAAGEAARALRRGIIVAPTGVGKSAIAALIIQKLQVRTLVVVPSLELKRQLTDYLGQVFGTAKVGETWQKRLIAVENVDALDTKSRLEGYDCVIIDEFHHSGARTYRELNKRAWSGIYYKFGLTATPFRSQDHERLLLESVLSQVIYEIKYKTAVDKGYIVPMEAYYIDLPEQRTKGRTWREIYSELVVNHPLRNKLISSLLCSLQDSKTPTLCLVKEIAHGKSLQEATNGFFANGQDEDTPHLIRIFNQGKLSTLIGTTGVLGEGVDTKPAEFIIIAGLGKSKNGFMQQVGRGFRRYLNKESCKIILIRDTSHKWTLAHYRAQVKHLREEYGIKPVRLEWPIEGD